MTLARISVNSGLRVIHANCPILVVLCNCLFLICAAISRHLSHPAPSSNYAVCGLQAGKRDMEDISKGQAGSNGHHFCSVLLGNAPHLVPGGGNALSATSGPGHWRSLVYA